MEPISIDAIVTVSPAELSPASPTMADDQRPPKLKGRQRLLEGLQRISSSPSLVRRSRAASSSAALGYRAGGRASMSCVSLSSSSAGDSHHAPSYGTSYGTSYGSSPTSERSTDFSTAPTSLAGTPGPDSPCFDRTRICFVDAEPPTSVGLPADVRLSTAAAVDYFSHPLAQAKALLKKRDNFNFWADLPPEIRMEILCYLSPREVVRCSAVSKAWRSMCFDGQLWGTLDTSDYYLDIPADALVNIITSAGPFVRDLNLRGCVQLRERWNTSQLVDACRNLEMFSLEGCRIDRTSIHCFLLQNTRLVHINLSGLAGATNSAMKIIAHHCPKLEHLNISWCNNIDTRGIRRVVEGCPDLKDLRAGEVRGWDDVDFMFDLFKRNTLERLVLNHCDSLNDDSLAALIVGIGSEIDVLTDRPIVPPRKLKHLDLMRCRGVTDRGFKVLAHNLPFLEGLQVSKCVALTDASLQEILPTLPQLTHLDLEELEHLTNDTLKTLASSACSDHLAHLSISFCENLGDTGMLPILKSCKNLATLDMDNTRISDLVLAEAAAMVRARTSHPSSSSSSSSSPNRPQVGLRLVAYDCTNVTWCGVREVLSRNAEIIKPAMRGSPPMYPREIIQLKCFYNWQPTVEEHTKRVLRGDFSAAARLERKWADWMMATEEAIGGGAGYRRRRRRLREAWQLHNDEAEDGTGAPGPVTRSGRRRARSGPASCTVM